MRLLACLVCVLSSLGPPAQACRCAQQNLADYFNAADHVFAGRLLSSTEEELQRVLKLEPIGRAYKGEIALANPILIGTGLSSASCGLAGDPGNMFIVFARRPAKPGALPIANTCDGSRLLSDANESFGFQDVPARFVAGQLNALAGLEALKQISVNHPAKDDKSGHSLVGLLDLKALAHGGNVRLFASPDANSQVVTTFEDYAAIDSRELEESLRAAVVYAKVDGWFRLRLRSGVYGWVAPDDAGTYFPYAELPVRRLAYLNEHWNGFVWPDLGAGIPSRYPPQRETPVEVLEAANLGGSLWFQINLLKSNGCDGAGERGLKASGWVPAYGERGEAVVWYYSRGC